MRETWNSCARADLAPADAVGPQCRNSDSRVIVYRAGGAETHPNRPELGKSLWRPSIYMPRWASRITLEVTGVRVERLQDISPKDILAEGVVERSHQDPLLGKCPISAFDGKLYPDLRSLWAAGWDAINGKRAPWLSNPWVWVVSFARGAL